MIDPNVGSGLVFWLPKGAIVRRELENFLYGELIRRGYQPVYTPVIGNVRSVRDFGPLSVLQGRAVPAHRDGRRRPLPAAADELPAPHHDLSIEAPQLPRFAAAAGGVRHGASLRAVGRVERHDPRPRLHAGRRPHLLHRRAGGRRVPRLHRDDATRAEDAGAGRLPRAVGLPRSGERQVRRQPGDLGQGRGGVVAGLRRDGFAEREHRARRGGVLRPEGRFRRHRLHRPRVAVGHRAVGLQSAQQAAIRPGVHRRRQHAAPAGDDPPRHRSARSSGSWAC